MPYTRHSHKSFDLSAFSYETPAHQAICINAVLPADTSHDVEGNVDLLAIIEWRGRYSFTGYDAEFTQRVCNWYASRTSNRLELEDICVLVERGKLSFKEIFAKLWPIFYENQRLDGAPSYESFDEWWIIEFAETFRRVISRSSAINAGEEHRIREIFITFDDAWGIYRPLRPRPPELPINGFPRVLQEYIKAQAEYSEVGQDMVTALVLGFLGSAVTNTVRLQLSNGYVEPLNPAFLILADSGGRKTGAFDGVFEPLDEIYRTILRPKNRKLQHFRKIEIDRLKDEIAVASKPKKEKEKEKEHRKEKEHHKVGFFKKNFDLFSKTSFVSTL